MGLSYKENRLLTGAEAVVKILEEEGIKYVFGIPGGSITPIYDALYGNDNIKHVLVRHEGSASFMADAYTRATGIPAACLGHVSVGAANLLIGVAAAYKDSVPMLVITGHLRESFLGKGAQMDLDNAAMFEPVTRWSVKVSRVEDIDAVFNKAFSILNSARPGPVHVSLPVDVQGATFEFKTRRKTTPVARPKADPELTIGAANLILSAERPLIWAGGGVINAGASQELKELAEVLNAPVATSYNGKGSFPENHVLSVGRTGQYTPKYVTEFVSQADVILAIGFRFTDVSTNDWKLPRESSKIVQIDIDKSEIGKNFPVKIGIHGEARSTLESLLKDIKNSKELEEKRESRDAWAGQLKVLREGYRQAIQPKTESGGNPIKPQRVMKELQKALRRDAIVTAAAGFCKDWASTLLEINEPRTWIHPAGITPMGYALCGAIGAKLAKPDRQVVAVTGDGAFQMVCQELITAVENDAPVLICMLNDERYGMIHYIQERRHEGRYFETEFREKPDFVKLAEAFGAIGKRIENPAELADALSTGLNSDKPYLLDIVIDKNEVPGIV